ncbi:SLATT domain-containing protein [Sulfitobacter sp. HNIBRBA2951]|uniref:SLATT domain-containing protein n=1 Tax=Sulfitobacter aquimarinus TaxID=3158557 RepID=UPI0032E00206
MHSETDKIAESLRISQMAHYACAERYQLKHSLVGGSAVVLTTVTSALTFFDAKSVSPQLIYLIPLLGVLSAVLVAVQTFSRFLERYEAHRIAAVNYGTLQRRLSYGQVQDAKEILKEWEDVSSRSPVTPTKVRDISKRKMKGEG